MEAQREDEGELTRSDERRRRRGNQGLAVSVR